MKEFKIVQNPINNMYNVVELHEDAFACPIGQGRTKSEAMRNGCSVKKQRSFSLTSRMYLLWHKGQTRLSENTAWHDSQ